MACDTLFLHHWVVVMMLAMPSVCPDAVHAIALSRCWRWHYGVMKLAMTSFCYDAENDLADYAGIVRRWQSRRRR
jgi:hypothetical protein